MATPYNHKEIEKKWRHNWDVTPINKDTTKPKYYCLDMFPYPSGSGLHEDIGEDMLLVMYGVDIRCFMVIILFILWDGMLLVFRQKTMLLR